MGAYQATSAALTGVLFTVIIVVGGLLVAEGHMTAVDMATFALYISLFTTPIETLVNSTENIQKAIAGFKRMDEVILTMPDIEDAPDARELTVSAGRHRVSRRCASAMKTRSWGSDRAGRPVIDHMDLSIRPGETIALVGPSGGGKTTTCSLLPRFYDVTSGSITIDGQDVRSVTQQSLRQAIGLVQQDVYLFDGTIGETSPTDAPGATQEEIRRSRASCEHPRVHRDASRRLRYRVWASAAAVFPADRSSAWPSRACS